MRFSDPLGSGETVTIRPVGVRAGSTRVFANTWMYCRKPRLRLTNPRSGRERGASFSLVPFLLDEQEK